MISTIAWHILTNIKQNKWKAITGDLSEVLKLGNSKVAINIVVDCVMFKSIVVLCLSLLSLYVKSIVQRYV